MKIQQQKKPLPKGQLQQPTNQQMINMPMPANSPMGGQMMNSQMMNNQMMQPGPQGQNNPNQMMQQIPQQQAQLQQSQQSQKSAFPQAQNGQGVSPHQKFIQDALKQGYSPDMVMQFLMNKVKQPQ
jgi:hypothetical protein